MLRTSVRAGLSAVRAAGWRPFAIAFGGYLPVVAFDALDWVAGAFPAAIVQMVLLLAVIRVLGAYRPEPIPAPPQVDEQGRRVVVPLKPGPPLSDEDRTLGGALRNALALWLPGLRLMALFVLTVVAGIFTLLAITAGGIADADIDIDVTGVALLPVVSLFQAFVALAPHRVALEGDPRVLVAAAHSVRIARVAYGLLLMLSIAEPLASLPGDLIVEDGTALDVRLAMASIAVVFGTIFQVVTAAIGNEVYLRGPRLELPVDAGG